MYVTVVKNLADAFFPNSKLSGQKKSVYSISDDRLVKRCKYKLCGKVGHLEKDYRKKKADLTKRMKQRSTNLKEEKGQRGRNR